MPLKFVRGRLTIQSPELAEKNFIKKNLKWSQNKSNITVVYSCFHLNCLLGVSGRDRHLQNSGRGRMAAALGMKFTTSVWWTANSLANMMGRVLLTPPSMRIKSEWLWNILHLFICMIHYLDMCEMILL